MQITRATSSTWKEILMLMDESGLTFWFTGKENYKDFYIVRRANEKEILCAFSIIKDKTEGILKSMAVPKVLQGHGIGLKVCSNMNNLCNELGIKKLFTATEKPTHIFWRKTSFKEIKCDEIEDKFFNDYLSYFKDKIENYLQIAHFFIFNIKSQGQ